MSLCVPAHVTCVLYVIVCTCAVGDLAFVQPLRASIVAEFESLEGTAKCIEKMNNMKVNKATITVRMVSLPR